jgi:hypothetical protein
LNCLIAHEIGHFVFQRFDQKAKLLPEVEKCLNTALSARSPSAEQLDWSRDRLLTWSEELFCDLFAIWLVGPCYSLACVELFGLTTILNPASPEGFSPTLESIIFSGSHPADLFRLRQHVVLLKESIGWWEKVDAIKSHYVDVLRIAASVDDKKFLFLTNEQDESFDDATLRGFFALTSMLEKVITEATRDLDSGVSEYDKFAELIENYLLRTVVPSTVFDGQNHWYPGTVALLNSSMKFSLESLEQLMNNVKGQKTFLAGHRSRSASRVESLTSKAIEDYYLLVGEKGAKQAGSSFKRGDLSTAE